MQSSINWHGDLLSFVTQMGKKLWFTVKQDEILIKFYSQTYLCFFFFNVFFSVSFSSEDPYSWIIHFDDINLQFYYIVSLDQRHCWKLFRNYVSITSYFEAWAFTVLFLEWRNFILERASCLSHHMANGSA